MECGPCSSCRLGVSSSTGRLRWCVAEKGSGRRVMWVLTGAVLTLVLATVAAVTVLRLADICSDSEENETSTAVPATVIGQYDREPGDGELIERSVVQDVTTWFVPPPPAFPPPPAGEGEDEGAERRSKRAISLSQSLWDMFSLSYHISPVKVNSPALSDEGSILETTPEDGDDLALWKSAMQMKPSHLAESAETRGAPVDGKVQTTSESEEKIITVDLGDRTGPVGGQGHGDTHQQHDIRGVWNPSKQPLIQIQVTKEVNNELQEVMPTDVSITARPPLNGTGFHLEEKQLCNENCSSTNSTPSSTAETESETVAENTTIPPEEPVKSTATLPRSTSTPSPASAASPSPAHQDRWSAQSDAATVRQARAKLMLEYMDPTVNPCNDFYTYACGGWVSKHPIPADKAAFDMFEMLRESLDFALREVLEDVPSKLPSDLEKVEDATLKAKFMYMSCMDHDVLATRGAKPLLQLLSSLGGWPVLDATWNASSFDWLHLVAQLRLYNNDVLIAEWVGPDVKNSNQNVIQLDQTSLGLPTRDYFLLKKNEQYLKAYQAFIVEVATLLGAKKEAAEADAEEVVAFETSLATIVRSAEERRNVSQLYRRMSLKELSENVSGIDWHRYFKTVLGRPLNDSEPIVIFALGYMNELVTLLKRTPPKMIANYILWRFVRHRINSLDDSFVAAKQRLLHSLFGREAVPPRWKTCVSHVNLQMGMALGALFVRKYFDQNSKQDTLEMTQDIMESFRDMLNSTEWIDPDTRRLALHKVDSMQLRIGYPDFIVDDKSLNERYKDVFIRPDTFFENTLNVLTQLTKQDQSRLFCPVNKTVWNTPPAVVNAYYSRNKNQIMFPAGILQPPFYHKHLPRSLNYGGIGVVIGHEITHGFDDRGRLFDEYGNLMRWWGDEAIDNFHKRAQCLINQYGKYFVPEVNLFINGENTQGENIADNGGIKQAFRAYRRWVSRHGDASETLPGINATNMQLFFLNFAQVWCGSMRPEAMRNKFGIAVHSPAKFRVIGTLSNSEEFAEVFGCRVGSPMHPEKKCSVW